MPEFEIRRAIIGDEALLRAVRIEALTDSPRMFSSTHERELARTTEDWRRWIVPGPTFLALADGHPRGLVCGVRDSDDPFTAHLMAMWVHAALRGSGAANALLSCVKDWAAEIGAKRLILSVVENNMRARRCYERAGFRLTGRQGIVEKSGDVDIEMVCEIQWP
jgi:ribosomal protein S18 acetylase RimI-like enzyme